jgi:putative MFS transporter
VHYRLLFIHGFGWLFDAMDVGIITFVLVALAKDWKLTSSQVGLIGSAGLAGMFAGAAVAGPVADRWGRKAVFQLTLLVFGVSTLLCAFAWSVPSMILFRFLVGVGLGGELPVVSSLLSEFVPRRSRGRFIVLLESFWAFGWLAAALVAFLVIPAYGWRIAFGIGVVPALYAWILRRPLPESPRWLEVKGRLDEAVRVVDAMEQESERVTGTAVPRSTEERGAESPVSGKPAFVEIWCRAYRRRTMMLWTLWFGLVFGYYGIFVWLPSLLVRAGYSMVNSFGYVVLITLAQIPGYFSAAYFVERFGRKPVIIVYLLLSAASAVLFGRSSSWQWAIPMSFFNLGAWGAVYAYTPEQYPTCIRATGCSWAAAFGRIGGLLAPITVGMLLPRVGRHGVLALNAGLLLVAAGAVLFLGTETKGLVLEETSE